MDLLIEKEELTLQLSELDVLVTDVAVSIAKVESTRDSVNFRNGTVFRGAVHTEKSIVVSGYYYAKDEQDDQIKQDSLNGIFGESIPFFISRMFSSTPLYSFERPGEISSLDLDKMYQQTPYKYRWEVILDSDITYSFQGKSEKGLLYQFSIPFVTSDLPYGITRPKDEPLNENYIRYAGTAPCSQLEHPFILELTATTKQNGNFSFTIGDQEFTYKSDGEINVGDVFALKGFEFLLNGVNINGKTNIQFFTLKPSRNKIIPIKTNFKGEIILKNKVEFYV